MSRQNWTQALPSLTCTKGGAGSFLAPFTPEETLPRGVESAAGP